ncbi:uncharacterized protein LOC128964120 [Oppia nitens]|uniref:uncharacterized protein LOC128964120 n=1 Tax=Oppia nitens TaxID=1686743 RepID=UPI0023DA78AB|nr:uncharacterized protein LOC128964120 [Oppia nitens]
MPLQSLVCECRIAMNVVKKEIPIIQKFYTKTLGQIKFDRIKGRTPTKGSSLDCVVKCSATYGCHCLRVNIETNECNIFVSTIDDPNAETNASILEKYIYYTNHGNKEGTGENLAIGKKLTQSSTYNQFKAQKAIDNNSRTASKTSDGKVNTKKVLPWLQIDLKDEYVITGVMLQSNDEESLHDFDIRVGNRLITKLEKGTHFKDNPLCYEYVGNKFLETNHSRVVKCEPCPLMGKYVTIQIINNCTNCSNPGNNYLNLAEIAVYGYNPK